METQILCAFISSVLYSILKLEEHFTCYGCYSQENMFLYTQNGAHKSLQQPEGG